MSQSPSEPVRILHVDDEPGFADTAAALLEREDCGLEVETETSANDGIDRLREGDFDCVVSDYDMPGRNGLEFLETVRADFPDLPFVLFTGKGSEEIASEAISAGVTDYLEKRRGDDQYALLANRVRNAVERYRSGHAVEERNRRLKTLIGSLPGMVYRCRNEPGFPMAFLGGECEELTGYAASEIESGEVLWGEDVVHPEDAAEGWAAIMEAVDAGDPFEITYRIVTADGTERWVWERGQEVRPDDGAPMLEGFITDITERTERERDLERYETILEAVGDSVYALDADGRYTYVNEAFVEATGYEKEQVLGEHVSLSLAEASVEAGEEIIRGLLLDDDRHEETVEMERITADGERVPIENTMVLLPFDGDGRFRGSAGIARDVTERKERERDLEQYETVVETVPVGVGVIDDEGVIVGGNRHAGEILGYDIDDLIGGPFRRLVEDGVYDEGFAETYREAIRDLLSDGSDREYAHLEYSIDVDGEERHVESRIALRPDSEGYRGTISVFWDVTERQRQRRELIRQNERLEEFAGIVSHDLRNPLAVLNGSLELAEENGDPDAFERCRRAAGRMEALIDDLLTLARQGDRVAETGAVDLAAVVEECWRTVATAGADLRVDTDRTIRADEDRLRQLLENLFGNAVEHGGEDVSVTIGDLDDGEGFFVEDDGVGLPDGDDDRLFESGYSTAEDGTGFGLAIVGRTAEIHGWTVVPTDGADGGARFEITGVETAR